MRLFFLWLIFTIGCIGDLPLAASGLLEGRWPQDDDPDTALTDLRADQFGNPSLGLGTGSPDISQVVENNLKENQEGTIISTGYRCRSPHRKRNPPDYCQNAPPPLLQQQQEKARPSGTINQDRSAEGKFILPAKLIPEWAPPLKDFFEMDPCQGRPLQACAPYLPGLGFRAWSSGRLAGFDLEGCDYCMYHRFRGRENEPNGARPPRIDSSHVLCFINQ